MGNYSYKIKGTIHPPAEIKYTLNDSQASIVIVHKSFADFFAPIHEAFPNLKYIEMDDFQEDPNPDVNILFYFYATVN